LGDAGSALHPDGAGAGLPFHSAGDQAGTCKRPRPLRHPNRRSPKSDRQENLPLPADLSTLLPPLIFEAAMVLRWRELRPDLLLIVALATVGLVLAAALTAAGMHWLAGWSWLAASLFGILIAATDPVW